MIEIWVPEKIFKFIHEGANFTNNSDNLDYLTFVDGVIFLKEKNNKMPTKQLMTREEATVLLKNIVFGLTDTGQAGKWVDFFIDAEMLEVKQEEEIQSITKIISVLFNKGQFNSLTPVQLEGRLNFEGYKIVPK